jgi:hypothetical protein
MSVFPRLLNAVSRKDKYERFLGNSDGFAASRLRDTHSSLLVRRWPPDVVCERLEILHDGREVELVANTGETSVTTRNAW